VYTAIRVSTECSISDVSFEGFDAAFDITDSKDVRISRVNVDGRVAVKGSRAKRLLLADITHSYSPCPTYLALAIWRAIYGNV